MLSSAALRSLCAVPPAATVWPLSSVLAAVSWWPPTGTMGASQLSGSVHFAVLPLAGA